MLVAISGTITRKIQLTESGFTRLHLQDETIFDKIVVGAKFETFNVEDEVIVVGDQRTDPKYGTQVRANHTWKRGDCPFEDLGEALKQLHFLHEELKLPVWLADGIFDAYLEQTIAVIQQNPYRIVTDGRVSRVGIKIVDKYFADTLKIDKRDQRRLRATILDTLKQSKTMFGLPVFQEESGEAYGQDGGGHSYVDYLQLVATCAENFEIGRKVVAAEIRAMAVEPRSDDLPPLIIIENEADKPKYIYQYGLGIAERGLAYHINRILTSPADRYLDEVSLESTTVPLSEEQKSAILMAMDNKISIVTGGPGVGKTTIISTVTSVLKKAGITFCLCAPTGIAAQRMASASSDHASTIHRLLKYNPMMGGFQYNDMNPLQDDFIVCDETSMVDTVLMFNLFQAIKTGARVLLVGDVDQLPPVGAGAPFRDLIAWQKIQTARLTKIYRQELADSLIIQGSRAILERRMPDFSKDPSKGDLFVFPYTNESRALETITDLVTSKITETFKIPREKIQVICPHRRAKRKNAKEDDSIKLLASENVNVVIQEKIHGKLPLGRKFTVGDRVIQTKNNYDLNVMNGEIGYVKDIDVKRGRSHEQAKITVNFREKYVTYDHIQTRQLDLAYAMSVHKSQGTEHEAVVVVAYSSQRFFSRNMLYTAITRGKRIVVVVSPKGAKSFSEILKTDETLRNSRLRWRLDNPGAQENRYKNDDWFLGQLEELSDEEGESV